MTAPEQEAATLAPFFAAARAAAPEPPVRLLSAILADAAEAGAAPLPSAPTRQTRGRDRWRAPLAPARGRWRAATALAACAMLGFWIGLAGGVTIDGSTLRAGAAVADAEADDPIETFLDLAAVE